MAVNVVLPCKILVFLRQCCTYLPCNAKHTCDAHLSSFHVQIFGATDPDTIRNDSIGIAMGFLGLAVGAFLILFVSVSSFGPKLSRGEISPHTRL